MVPALVALALLSSACTTGAGDVASPDRSPAASGAASDATSGVASPDGAVLPGPDEPIGHEPSQVAEQLRSAIVGGREAIDRWIEEGDPSTWPPPGDVELLALFQQRIYRTLARDPTLARRVLGRLPASVRWEAEANVSAVSALLATVRPVKSVHVIRTQRPEPAGVLLGWFREAEERFGVDWELLAAVMLVESRFGRVVSKSWAGAQGPMQFLPSTWEAYGLGGDVHDPHDAILGAANYLGSSGAPTNDRAALYAYNPLSTYVDAVSAYARVMRRDPSAYLAYYDWQVFVVTGAGDVRVTGPGL
jgi:hypothetical protein